MTVSWIDLLVNPNRFFQQALGDTEQLKMPGLVVLAAAILGAAAGYFAGSLSARMLDTAMGGMGSIILIVAVLAAFVMTFVVWVVWAGVFYLIGRAFKGTGSFNRCLEVAGYGYLPQVIGAVITVILAFEYLPRVAVPSLTSAALTNPEQIQAATLALTTDPAMVQFTQLSGIVAIVFLLWSANCWIFGIRQVQKLSLKNAAITVGIPVILFVIFQLYKLAGM